MYFSKLILSAILLNLADPGPIISYADDLEIKALEIHGRVLTLDSHTDTPLLFGREGFDIGKRNDPMQRGGQVDFPRMIEGGLDAAFFAVFIGQGERTPTAIVTARRRALDIFDLIHKSVADYSEIAGLALTPDDAYKLREEGRLAIYIGLENGYPAGNDPVIASHSNSRAVCNHPRNLDDDMLLALKENGGVIQVCILSAYVKTPEPNPEREAAQQQIREQFNNFENLTDDELQKAREEWYALNEIYPQKLATVTDLVDHIDHIAGLIGIEHVGIGTDFDGGGSLSDCLDVTELGSITLELVRRGYSEEEIEKIWAGNFMRVFTEVENAKGSSGSL